MLPRGRSNANTISIRVKLSLVSLNNSLSIKRIDDSRGCVLWATLPCSYIRPKHKEKVTTPSRPEVKARRAQEFRALMLKYGWTRAELSRQLGVSRAWVTRVLKKSE